jgi:hypothetical protein
MELDLHVPAEEPVVTGNIVVNSNFTIYNSTSYRINIGADKNPLKDTPIVLSSNGFMTIRNTQVFFNNYSPYDNITFTVADIRRTITEYDLVNIMIPYYREVTNDYAIVITIGSTNNILLNNS